MTTLSKDYRHIRDAEKAAVMVWVDNGMPQFDDTGAVLPLTGGWDKFAMANNIIEGEDIEEGEDTCSSGCGSLPGQDIITPTLSFDMRGVNPELLKYYLRGATFLELESSTQTLQTVTETYTIECESGCAIYDDATQTWNRLYTVFARQLDMRQLIVGQEIDWSSYVVTAFDQTGASTTLVAGTHYRYCMTMGRVGIEIFDGVSAGDTVTLTYTYLPYSRVCFEYGGVTTQVTNRMRVMSYNTTTRGLEEAGFCQVVDFPSMRLTSELETSYGSDCDSTDPYERSLEFIASKNTKIRSCFINRAIYA